MLKPGCFQRCLATFFLIFTFVDIVVIDLLGQRSCSEEAAVLPLLSTTSYGSDEIQVNARPGLAAVEDDAQNQPASPAEHMPAGTLDEDCFCCCSHLIPGIRVDLAVLNGSPQPGDPAILNLPTSPLRSTFHPPRFS